MEKLYCKLYETSTLVMKGESDDFVFKPILTKLTSYSDFFYTK